MTTPGGWCAPSETVYDPAALGVGMYEVLTLPEVSVSRGGMSYAPPTAAERAARDAMQAMVARLAERAMRLRTAAINAGIAAAYEGGWDLHVYEPPPLGSYGQPTDLELHRLAYVGIELRERTHDYAAPVIHMHQEDESVSDWWEEEL